MKNVGTLLLAYKDAKKPYLSVEIGTIIQFPSPANFKRLANY